MHSGEKSNKCNQCDFASSRPDHLRQHLKMHSGEKSNECNQCDFSCSDRNSLRRQCSREKSHYYYLLLICPRNRIKAYYVLRGLRSEDQGLRIEKQKVDKVELLEIQKDNNFADVTLVCEDGKQVEAHDTELKL